MRKAVYAGVVGVAAVGAILVPSASAHSGTIFCNNENGNLIDIELSEFPTGPIVSRTFSNNVLIDTRTTDNRNPYQVLTPDDTDVKVVARGVDGQDFTYTFYKDCLAFVPQPPASLPPTPGTPTPVVTLPQSNVAIPVRRVTAQEVTEAEKASDVCVL